MTNSLIRAHNNTELAKLSIVDRELRKRINKALIETGKELGEAYRRTIEDESSFNTGEDLVYTGALRDSQRIKVSLSTVEFSWDVPYAEYVRVGYTLINGKFVTGRDWVDKTNRDFNFSVRFLKNMEDLNAASFYSTND